MGVNSYGIGRGGQQQQQHQQGGRGGRGGRNNSNNNGRGRGRSGRGGGRGGNSNSRGGNGGRSGRGDTNLKYDSSQYDRIEEINGVGVVNISDSTSNDNDIIRIAIEGCCHGELDLIYDRLLDHELQTKTKIDLLLCCGDFQSLRNELDFQSSSIPSKYQKLGTFCQYYSGQKKAPIPTIFIGGNHEASQSLRELYYGGYVAPNIYFMGAAASIIYRGIRIGGISGIYKSFDYTQGHHERIPYDYKSNKSVYHTRNVDIERMKSLKSSTTTSQEDNKKKKLDIVLSHDWPLGIEQHGNTQALIRKKPFFRQEIQNNDLGSTPNRDVLDTLQPKYWFAAHLHVKFHATVIHKNDFLALDKCLPRRQFLSILNLKVPDNTKTKEYHIEYDPEWLAILKKTHHWNSTQR
ncbi:hypothetical protein FRACYDRAFT_196939, partial [Fragilariopsis cylindrus CCMP1102]